MTTTNTIKLHLPYEDLDVLAGVAGYRASRELELRNDPAALRRAADLLEVEAAIASAADHARSHGVRGGRGITAPIPLGLAIDLAVDLAEDGHSDEGLRLSARVLEHIARGGYPASVR